jgi:hypothetical protein
MIWRGADADRNINVFVRPMFKLGILDARVREHDAMFASTICVRSLAPTRLAAS